MGWYRDGELYGYAKDYRADGTEEEGHFYNDEDYPEGAEITRDMEIAHKFDPNDFIIKIAQKERGLIELPSTVEQAEVRGYAPLFKALAYWDAEQYGEEYTWDLDHVKPLALDDYLGRYVVLFFYPGDFNCICAQEVVDFSHWQPEFEQANCTVIGVSVDSVHAHR